MLEVINKKLSKRHLAVAVIAGILIIVLLCRIVLLRNPSIISEGRADLFTNSKSMDKTFFKDGPGPRYLRWNFDLNVHDNTFTPGQDITLDLTLTGEEEEVTILGVPSIKVTRRGRAEQEEIIDNILLPQLKDMIIKKGETRIITSKFKAPMDYGVYIMGFDEMKMKSSEGTTSISLGGPSFTVLAPKTEVHFKDVSINKEINTGGNLMKFKNIIMNDKETRINYTISYGTKLNVDFSFKLITDSGEVLYSTGWMGDGVQEGVVHASVSFNPISIVASKLTLEISNLREVTSSEGAKYIDGKWEINIPIN